MNDDAQTVNEYAESESSLVGQVADALHDLDTRNFPDYVRHIPARTIYIERAQAAISVVRRHDEQAALDCGFCSEPDDIRCACEVEASTD